MLRRSPIYTLFPYTTLFRSRCILLGVQRSRANRQRDDHQRDDPIAGQWARSGSEQSFHSPFLSLRKFRTGWLFFLRDRKSTRLNSSHVEISYAVFCLKKKKQ